jgi:hypothetical protein
VELRGVFVRILDSPEIPNLFFKGKYVDLAYVVRTVGIGSQSMVDQWPDHCGAPLELTCTTAKAHRRSPRVVGEGERNWAIAGRHSLRTGK